MVDKAGIDLQSSLQSRDGVSLTQVSIGKVQYILGLDPYCSQVINAAGQEDKLVIRRGQELCEYNSRRLPEVKFALTKLYQESLNLKTASVVMLCCMATVTECTQWTRLECYAVGLGTKLTHVIKGEIYVGYMARKKRRSRCHPLLCK